MQKGDYIETKSKKSQKSTFKETFDQNVHRFLKVKDELGGEEIRVDLFEGLLTSEDVDSEIDKVSISFTLMSMFYAYAEERYENERLQQKKLIGELTEEASNDENIMGRPTDNKIKAWVEGHPRYIKQVRRINRYQRQMTIFKQAYLAFDMKSRMLQTKSANSRKLLDQNDPGDNSFSSNIVKKKKKKKVNHEKG